MKASLCFSHQLLLSSLRLNKWDECVFSHLLLCGIIPNAITSRATTPTPDIRIRTRSLPAQVQPERCHQPHLSSPLCSSCPLYYSFIDLFLLLDGHTSLGCFRCIKPRNWNGDGFTLNLSCIMTSHKDYFTFSFTLKSHEMFAGCNRWEHRPHVFGQLTCGHCWNKTYPRF